MSKQIPDGWRFEKLGKYLKEIKERKSDLEGLPVLSVTNTQGFVLSEDFFDRKVYSKNLDNYKIVRRGQFAYNPSRLNVGSLAHLKEFEAGLLSPMYVVFEALSEIDSDFLGCWLTSGRTKNLIKASTQGTVRDSVNFSALSVFPIDLPLYSEQQKIAAILGSVDRAIEKTRAVISQTHRLKKAMMQELLIRGIPGRHKRFKKTPIGEIPEQWEVVRLGDVLKKIEAGKSPNCPGHPAKIEEWGVLKVSSISWDIFKPFENKALPENFAPIYDLEVKEGDILISRANTKDLVGATVLVTSTRPYLMLSDKTLRLIPDDTKTDKNFLLLCLRGEIARRFIEQEATGTSKSMKNISQGIIRSIKIALPQIDEQKNIASSFASLHNNISTNECMIEQLRLIKTTLMQVLLTGEVRVKPLRHQRTYFIKKGENS